MLSRSVNSPESSTVMALPLPLRRPAGVFASAAASALETSLTEIPRVAKRDSSSATSTSSCGIPNNMTRFVRGTLRAASANSSASRRNSDGGISRPGALLMEIIFTKAVIRSSSRSGAPAPAGNLAASEPIKSRNSDQTRSISPCASR